MPRVLLTGFCAVPGPRRAGVQLRHVIRSLTPSHSVDVLVAREGEQAYVERQGTVRVLRVPTPEADLKSQIQSFQRALKRQLEGADYDVVHCRDSWSGVTVLEARPRLDYAVVYDLTRAPSGESVVDPELDAQYGRDEEACLLAADLVLVPTAAAAKAIAGRGRPERVVVSPPGVDVDRFDWEDPPTGDVPRILYTGSIDPGRGVRVLIRAMAAIVRDVDARLVLAGPVVSPKFDQALRDGIRELGLTDKVELLGVVDHDQLPALLATATVCVVPAASDLTPNPTVVYPTKILEYMACKRAVVAPRRETVLQVVEHGRDALLFEAGDPIDLAAKVVQLLRDPALRERIAAAGYERVRREFTASAARRALRAAYAVISERFAGQFAASPAGRSAEDRDADRRRVRGDRVRRGATPAPGSGARSARRLRGARGGPGRARWWHRGDRGTAERAVRRHARSSCHRARQRHLESLDDSGDGGADRARRRGGDQRGRRPGWFPGDADAFDDRVGDRVRRRRDRRPDAQAHARRGRRRQQDTGRGAHRGTRRSRHGLSHGNPSSQEP